MRIVLLVVCILSFNVAGQAILGIIVCRSPDLYLGLRSFRCPVSSYANFKFHEVGQSLVVLALFVTISCVILMIFLVSLLHTTEVSTTT